MWKKISYLFAFVLMVCLCANFNANAGNEITNEPYDTRVMGLEGQLVASSMAYEAINVLNLGFATPEDIYIADDNTVYIADSSAIVKEDKTTEGVIFKYNPVVNNGKPEQIGVGQLKAPKGVCLDVDGNIYVADSDQKAIIVFDKTGKLIKKIGAPDPEKNPLYGEGNDFTPLKVSVDRGGNIYVVTQSNSNGIVQLKPNGEFIGYFGRNMTKNSLEIKIKRFFTKKEERDKKYPLTPPLTSNIAIDNKNVVYTLVKSEEENSLKKYNINGTNLLGADLMFEKGYQDVAVDDKGFIYTVSDNKENAITVRDKDGNILFTFGNKTTNSMSVGHFDEAIGIDVDSEGNIWVLDCTGKNLQVFTRTIFASTVMTAMNYYNEGLYKDAEDEYHKIIAQNASFVQAYIGLGNIAQRNQDFELARHYFKIANHKAGYSDAFWEIRDGWLSRNLLWIAIVIVVLVALKLFKVRQRIFKLAGWDLTPVKEKIKNNSYYKEFSYLPKMLKKPNDVIYDIKFLQKIRFSTGLIFFALFVFVNIFCDTFLTAYIFRTQLDSQVNLGFELLKWGVIILLIVIGNFLVSSLQKGEGFFRDTFIGVMVAFAPVLIFKAPLAIVSNVLTFNEAYLVDIINIAIWAWSIFNVILVFKSVHNYSLGELILNILLTVVAVVILVFLFLMVYILFMQFYEFVVGLIKEAVLR